MQKAGQSIGSVMLVSLLVALAVTLSIYGLNRWAGQSAKTELRLVDLKAALNAVDGLEWRAISKKQIDAELDESIEHSLRRSDQLIDAIGRVGDDQNLQPLYQAYVLAIKKEFALIKAGEIDEALEFDEATVDAAFDQVAKEIARAVTAMDDAHRRVRRYAELGMGLSLLFAALTVGWLFAKFARARERHASELEASSHRLEHSLQLLQSTMDATLDGLLVLGADGLPVQINRQLVELWAVPERLAHAQAGPELLDHLRSQVVDAASMSLDPRGGPGPPTVLELKDGRAFECLSRAHQMHGERVGTVYSFRDVTERERSATLMRHQALHDSLSGLPNRLQFSEALDRAVVQAQSSGAGLAVLFVDLDHFKRVNDTLGHDFGDKLLQRTAARLAACLREVDLVARWGGDEFTVLAPNIRSADEATSLARRILEALDEPFVLDEMTLQVSASVGLASYPTDGEDGQSLLRRADMALYRAKQEGRNGFQCFRHSAFADIGSNGGLSLEIDLRRAIEGGELLLHYQPQIDTRTGLITGTEALARWNHPEHGWIGPATFIPIAERTGMIVALGESVLRMACRQAVAWRDEGLGDIPVAVNISAIQFDRSDLEAIVMGELKRSGLAPESLELEVTEAVALRHLASTASTLLKLQLSGVKIALDDFGTGYASMTYLKQLPCDKLKIDRSFIDGLEAGSKDAAIIRALVALTDGLGLSIVAEGVETKKVSDALQQLGCWTMQGYLFSRPVAADELTALLRRQRRPMRLPASTRAQRRVAGASTQAGALIP